jgi:uncharacterized protein (TIGR03067 family)
MKQHGAENPKESAMKQLLLALVLGGTLAFGAARAGAEPKKPLAELEGTWVIVKMEIAGKSLLEKNEKWQLVIKDGKVTTEAKGAPREATDLAKLLDPSRKPKTITFPYEGKITFYGIYEVRGNELRVCGDGVDTSTEKNPEARRPGAFDSNKGLLLVFKRAKK